MFSQFFDGSNVNLVIALMAGFSTFFASCLLPLVPTYLAYLSGVSLSFGVKKYNRWQVLKVAIFFVLGFISTFIILGLALNKFSSLIGQYRPIISQLSGLLFITMGMFMLGVFKHRLFTQERKINIDGFFIKNRSIHSFLTGVAFGFGWTPCIGPILAIILFWSVQAETVFKGISLLTAYGIGLGVPFLLIAVVFEKIMPVLKKYKKISKYINYIAGSIIIFAGMLMISGNFQKLAIVLSKLINLEIFSI